MVDNDYIETGTNVLVPVSLLLTIVKELPEKLIRIVAVSGYKPHELGIFKNEQPEVEYIKKALRKQLEQLAQNGLEWVIISGQLGTELWAAEITYELQMEYEQLKVGVFTPFLDQEENWKEDKKEYYEYILSQADYVNSITNKKYENPNQFRLKNHFFVDKSDALLLLYDDEKPGNPQYILEEAKKKSEKMPYEIIMINSYDLQMIVEEELLKRDDFWT
ncbi:putative phage-like protein YoqJ [Bacillus luteolus]|nr:putative phage-like protein YoqJ [Cytobacillus luteolus]